MAWPKTPTVYRSWVRVDRSDIDKGEILLLTAPHPIHAARLTRRSDRWWKASWVSMPWHAPFVYPDESSAITDAADRISRAAGLDFRQKFVGIQRIAIGQQKCPYPVKGTICEQSAQVGTIWCAEHWGGRRHGA